jgi:pyruvate/2-oxoglutarate dehydrogenase complex dihydrolipoamide acyltransferase (E2) component
VPSIKAAENMNFAAFWSAYEDVVRRARNGKLTLEDFKGTTVTLTNPGTIGTNHSVPRLMAVRARSSASARWSIRRSSRAPPSARSPTWPSPR